MDVGMKGMGVLISIKDLWVETMFSTNWLTWAKLLDDFKDGIVYVELDVVQYITFFLTFENVEFF
jgi:hypothetical protein